MIGLSLRNILLIFMIIGTFYSLFVFILADVVFIYDNPSVNAVEKLGIDIGVLLIASQGVMTDSIQKMASSQDDIAYSNFLFNRLIAGTVLSILWIYIFYIIFKKLPGLHKKSPLFLILLSLFVVSMLQVFAALAIFKMWIYPFQGFIDVMANGDVLVNYLNQTSILAQDINIPYFNQSVTGIGVPDKL